MNVQVGKGQSEARARSRLKVIRRGFLLSPIISHLLFLLICLTLNSVTPQGFGPAFLTCLVSVSG